MQRLQSVQWTTYSLPLRAPLRMACGTFTHREGLLIRLCTATHEAWGEASPLPGLHTESLSEVQEALTLLRPSLEAMQWEPSTPLWHEVLPATSLPVSLQMGLEMAMLNLQAQHRRQPLCAMLNPKHHPNVPLQALLTGSIDDLSQEIARCKSAAYHTYKLKVGLADLDEDLARVAMTRERIGPHAALRLDANRAWSFQDALHFARKAAPYGIQYIEEPLQDPQGLQTFYQETGLPYALDESLQDTLSSHTELPRRGCKALILKPGCLGWQRTQRWLAVAREHHPHAIFSSTFEADIGRAFLLAWAAALPQPPLAMGLDTQKHFQESLLDAPLAPLFPCPDPTRAYYTSQRPKRIYQDALTPANTSLPPSHTPTAPKDQKQTPNNTKPTPHNDAPHSNQLPRETFVLDAAAASFGAHPALIDETGILTYQDLAQSVEASAQRLVAEGIKPNDRVAILGENSKASIILCMAAIRLGAIVAPLSTRIPHAQLASQLETIKARALFRSQAQRQAHPDRLPLPQEAPEPLENYVASLQAHTLGASPSTGKMNPPGQESHTAQRAQASPTAPLASKAAADHDWLAQDATLIFTSGSTSTPKAALHTYGNHLWSAAGANANIPFVPGDRWLLSLPMYHVGGLSLIWRAALGGGALVLPSPTRPLLEQLTYFRITHLSLVATQLRRLLDQSEGLTYLTTGCKALLTGGGPIPQTLLTRAAERQLPLYTTYGLTEMASQVTTTPPHAPLDAWQSAGRCLSYREVRCSQEGEILVKGPTLFRGYLHPDGLQQPFDDDGWFATGDLGHIDQDGNLYVSGRKDNMFISGGENIQPEEIEAHLTQHPEISLAIVLPHHDPEFGARPVAFLRCTTSTLPSTRSLRAFLEARLPRFKIPKSFLPWPDDPRCQDLKPKRSTLAQHLPAW